MKHPPYIKKNFCDKVTVNIYYSMHCVMVIRTTHHCVMGCEIARMWQSAKYRLTKKSYKKHLFCKKKCVNRTTFTVCTTSQPYQTFAFILLKNNF